MEINGIANIKLLVEMGVMENVEHHQVIDPALADKIIEQLDTLERYMLAYKSTSDSLLKCAINRLDHNGSIKIPAWHDVRDNKDKYPLLRERMSGSDDRSNT